MAENENFTIEKARGGTIVVTVTGVTSWTGILAKLVASEGFGVTTPDISLTGIIDPVTNKISFSFTQSHTELLTSDLFHFEVILYKSDGSFGPRNCTKGMLTLEEVILENPNA